ncbi:MAG: triose-phosphate isomerase [Candidatus Hodarchaeota archaeon]
MIGGNWKMQITQVQNAVRIAKDILKGLKQTHVDVFIAPSANALYSVGKVISNSKLSLAGQNIHYFEEGAFTGQISILSLIDAGCSFVLLGHSEPRRIFGETDKLINLKVLKAVEKGIKPVLCIGESAKEREEGQTTEIIQIQLERGLRGLTAQQLSNVIIAYEPVWAINNKFLNPDTEIKPATPEQASEAHKFIRDWISSNFEYELAENIPIIYGGSMNPSNAKKLLELEHIDGGLIGGASLIANSFLQIIQLAEDLS